MEYRVIKMFIDLQDKNRQYNVGDKFPRVGLALSEKRIEELSTSKNRRGEALIEAVEDAEEANTEEVMEEASIAPIAEDIEKESEKNADNSVDTIAEKGEESKPKKGRRK